ncbi:porin family protein [Flavobacterium sp. SLB02]|uniref:porin family protein n=1 Tax=Flavobacterium sp. SLB02 TaxID=2665645 RepID=UPI0012A787E7|nr:porin family protein [Flavobacterium sp. SLB02]QGK76787.1 porin family protein [Flavobacterium sp. SLB02]
MTQEKIGDSKATNFEISPKVGYQFADTWTIGAEGAIGSLDVKGSEKTENYKIGRFVRYSTSFSQLFSFYADLGAGYQNTSLNNAKGMYASFDPGLFINMKRGFGLNFSIGGIKYDNLDGKNDPRQERLGFDFGKTFNIGIPKNFGL